jgi:hypothetical protein
MRLFQTTAIPLLSFGCLCEVFPKLIQNKPGKLYSVPEYTEFPDAFFATRILKYQIRLAPGNRFVKNINSFN